MFLTSFRLLCSQPHIASIPMPGSFRSCTWFGAIGINTCLTSSRSENPLFSLSLSLLLAHSLAHTYKRYQIKQRKVCQLWNYCSSGPLFLHPLRKVMDSRESKGCKEGKKGMCVWGRLGMGLTPPCISVQAANLHLLAVAPSLRCVLLHCYGVWISAGGGFSVNRRGESGSTDAESGRCLNRIIVFLRFCQAKDLHKEKKIHNVQDWFHSFNMLFVFFYISHNAILGAGRESPLSSSPVDLNRVMQQRFSTLLDAIGALLC